MRTAIRRGEGEILTLGRGRTRPVEILVEPGTTGCTAFTMGAQSLLPEGEVPLHQHVQEEVFFVYAGTGRFTVGGVAHEIGPETAVFVPSNVYHRIENTGREELRWTFTLSPAGYERVFRDLAERQDDHPVPSV